MAHLFLEVKKKAEELGEAAAAEFKRTGEELGRKGEAAATEAFLEHKRALEKATQESWPSRRKQVEAALQTLEEQYLKGRKDMEGQLVMLWKERVEERCVADLEFQKRLEAEEEQDAADVATDSAGPPPPLPALESLGERSMECTMGHSADSRHLVFVSFRQNPRDVRIASYLGEALDYALGCENPQPERPLKGFVNVRCMPVGVNWKDAIARALHEASLLVLLVSKELLIQLDDVERRPSYVLREIRWATVNRGAHMQVRRRGRRGPFRRETAFAAVDLSLI